MNWHKRLTAAREAKGLRKSAFAKLVGVSAPTVTDWENGETKMIEGTNLLKVCEILEISPEHLMRGEEKTAGNEVRQHDRPDHTQWVTADEDKLLTLFRCTDDEGRAEILRDAAAVRRVAAPGAVGNKV